MKVAKIPKGSLLIWSSRHLAKFCLIGLISAQNFKSQNSAKYHHGWTLPEENGSRPGCSILSRGLSLSSINWSPSVDHHQAEFFSAPSSPFRLFSLSAPGFSPTCKLTLLRTRHFFSFFCSPHCNFYLRWSHIGEWLTNSYLRVRS